MTNRSNRKMPINRCEAPSKEPSLSSIPIIADTTEEPCSRCLAECCRYVGVEVDLADTDYIRYLFLQGATLVASFSKTTQALLPTKCSNLGSDNRCMDYTNRPDICREHTSEGCLDNPDLGEDYRLYTMSDYTTFMGCYENAKQQH